MTEEEKALYADVTWLKEKLVEGYPTMPRIKRAAVMMAAFGLRDSLNKYLRQV